MTQPRTAATFSPPVMEARRWLQGVTHPEGRPLLNVSQAAPVDPPPVEMRAAMAEIIVSALLANRENLLCILDRFVLVDLIVLEHLDE